MLDLDARGVTAGASGFTCHEITSRWGGSHTSTVPHGASFPSSCTSYMRPPARGSITAFTALPPLPTAIACVSSGHHRPIPPV